MSKQAKARKPRRCNDSPSEVAIKELSSPALAPSEIEVEPVKETSEDTFAAEPQLAHHLLPQWPEEPLQVQTELPPTTDGVYVVPSFTLYQDTLFPPNTLHVIGRHSLPSSWSAESKLTASTASWTQSIHSESPCRHQYPLLTPDYSWLTANDYTSSSRTPIESPLSSHASSHSSPLINFESMLDDSTQLGNNIEYTGDLEGLQLQLDSQSQVPTITIPPSVHRNIESRPPMPLPRQNRLPTGFSPQRTTGRKRRVIQLPKSHICPECHREFDRKSNLSAHQNVHRAKQRPPVACTFEDCERAFGRKADLNRHIKSAHDGEEYQCMGCSKIFGRQDTLARHLKTACRTEQIFGFGTADTTNAGYLAYTGTGNSSDPTSTMEDGPRVGLMYEST